MSDKPYLAMTGKSKKGGKGFEIKSELDTPADPVPPEPHLIHNGTGVKCCSVCATPVNIPSGGCGTCTNCGAQFGGCG